MAYDDEDEDEEYYDEPETEEPEQPPAPPEQDDWEPYVEPEEPPPEADVKLPGQYAQAAVGPGATMSDAGPDKAPADEWEPYVDPPEPTPRAPSISDTGDVWSGQEAPPPVTRASDNEWQTYVEPDSPLGAFSREVAHGGFPAAAGAVTGAAIGGGLGAAGMNPVTVIGGTLVGGVAGGYMGEAVQEKGLRAWGMPDDAAIRRANEEAHPWSTYGGKAVSNIAGGAAGFGKAVVTTGARLLGGGIGAAWESGVQLYHGRPAKEAIPAVLSSAAGGAGFAGDRPWTKAGRAVGANVGARFKPDAPPPPAAPPAPAAEPPQQGQLAFGDTQNPPYLPKAGGPQEAQIGGGEAQPRIPVPEPPPPARPGTSTQPELGLEPPPVVNAEGQYGFSINAPHQDSRYAAAASRDSMPAAAGTSREAAPPAPLPPPVVSGSQPATGTPGSTAHAVGTAERAAWESQQRAAPAAPSEPPPQALGQGPHSVVTRGRAEIGAGPQAAAGIHVLQPGQMDPTIQHGIKVRTADAEPPPRTRFEPSRPPEQGPPAPPSGEIIPPGRALVPHQSESTRAITEQPVATGHTRMYQGERQPPNTFTTNRQAAEAYGPVKYVDVNNKQGMPFFTPGRDAGNFTTRNNIYRTRSRPVQEIATSTPPTGTAAEPTPGARTAAEPPPGARIAPPDLEGRLKQAGTPAAAAQPPAPAAAAPRQMIWRVKGENRPVRVSPVPAKPGYVRITYKGKDYVVPGNQLHGSAAAPSTPAAGAKSAAPGETITLRKLPDGRELKGTVKSVTTFSKALDQHNVRAGLLREVSNFVGRAVVKVIGDMPVYVVSRGDLVKGGGSANTIGYYDKQLNHIVINDKYLNNPTAMAHAILHEGVHGVTAHALDNDPKFRAAIRAVMIDLRYAAPTQVTRPEIRNAYKNVNEFVAEAFSSPDFQKLLRGHNLSQQAAEAIQAITGKQTSAWDGIVQIVRKLLGVPASKTNALESVMRTTEQAMRVNEAVKAKFMKGQGFKRQDYSIDELPDGRGEVTARDKFGNEAGFTGATVHEAAVRARAAGYKQIFNKDGTPYTPPSTPAAAAIDSPGGGKHPPAGGPPPAGGLPASQRPPATTLEGARASILSQIAEKPPWHSKLPTSKEEAKAAWRRFYTATKNAMDPIEQARKLSAEKLSPEQEFAMLARLTKGMAGRFQAMMKHGTYDIGTGKINGKSLDEVIKPIANDPAGFTAYALSKRVIELEGRGIKTGMNIPDARRVVAEEAHKYEPVFRDLVAFQDRVLENLVRTGILSEPSAAKMRQLNKEYVPFYRMLDPNSELGQQLGAGLQTKNPIFRIKGSDKEVFDPIDSIIKNTYVFTDLAHRNQALVAMRDFNSRLPEGKQFMVRDRSSHPIEVTTGELQKWMDKHGIEGFADEAMTIFRPNAFRPADDKIRLYSNGRAEVYKVDPEIGKAVNAMDQQSQELWLKIVATPARMLRAGAVLSPEFMLRNPLRDALTAFIQAKHGSIPIVDQYIGLKELFKKGTDYQEWLINGGANANLVSLDRAVVSTDPLSIKGVANVVKDPRQWLEPLRKLSEMSENATRIGMYKRARGKGAHQLEAAYSAREGTLDFSRIGAHGAMRAANAMIPFLNVHLQGLDTAARAFRDNPTGFLAKVGVGITLPSVLLWFNNKDNERVQQLPAWQRDLFWIVPTDDWKPMSAADRARFPEDLKGLDNTIRRGPGGGWERNAGTIYRIPKPFELGVIFGSIPERVLDAYFKEKPGAFKGLSKTMERALIPSYVPQAALPVMEQWANRSLFLDRTLLTEQQQKLPPAQQFGPYTSETAKLMGQVIRGVAGDKSSFGSPIIIDNYIRQWSGGLGKHATDIIDTAIKSTKDLPPEPTKSPADMPGYKAFVARFPDRGAQAIQDFYDLRNDRKVEQAGIKELRKTDPKGAAERMSSSSPYTGEPFAKILKGHRDAVTRITNDKDMSPDDKRAAIDLTYLLMIEHAKKGVESIEQTKRKAAP